jgi:glycosyltransferase involved in cell wall biosynthesis
MRDIDRFRLEADPWLRRSYANAACIIGVAPYVRDILRSVPLRRFEVMSELGVDEPLPPLRPRPRQAGELRLLHVARAVRTKGLRDAIRALALVKHLPGVTLTQAGDGEELAICKAEAARLGIESRVNFLGRVPREEVERLYEESDVFLFPSFREPSGSVIFEAMRHALPIIAADRGGPGHAVTPACGIEVSVMEPEQFAAALADAIARCAASPDLLAAMSAASRQRAIELGSWPAKTGWMINLYNSILAEEARSGAAAR